MSIKPSSLAATALITLSASLNAAAVELSQATINKINQDFLDRYQVNIDCSKGVASPQIKFFAKGKNVYMNMDSNSSLGFSVAELQEVGAGKYNHEEGLRFFTGNIANTTDFFISSETLEKGQGELTVILYRDIYKCDAKLDTWAVKGAIEDVANKKQALLNIEIEKRRAKAEKRQALLNAEIEKRGSKAEIFKREFTGVIEQGVYSSVVAAFVPPVSVMDNLRVIYKIVIRDSDGVVASVTPIELSQNVDFNAKAAEAFRSVKNLGEVDIDKQAMNQVFARARAADISYIDAIGENIVVYLELNASKTFIPVPERFRR